MSTAKAPGHVRLELVDVALGGRMHNGRLSAAEGVKF